MKLETPGVRQSKILEALYFSLPHKPIVFPAPSLDHNHKRTTRVVTMPSSKSSKSKIAGESEYSDDSSADDYSTAGEEEMSDGENMDSDAQSEPLSDTEDDDSEFEEEEELEEGEVKTPPPEKAAPKTCRAPVSKGPPVPKPSLSKAMNKKNLFGSSSGEDDKDIPPFPLEMSKSTESKTKRLTAGVKKCTSQELIPIGKKAAEKKQGRLNFLKTARASPKKQTENPKPKSSPKPKPKPKPKSKSKPASNSPEQPPESFEASLQTKKTAKMENGTYRGKTAYIVHRGNISSRYIIQIPRRGRKNHPVLGKSDKMPTLTEQVRGLQEKKQLRFRDLTYVYIHVDNGKGKTGVFVAGLFTSSGSITHVNATTIELPAYKDLYAEEGGTSHRQAKIKDVINSCNKQKGTNFVLQLLPDPASDGADAVELQLPFLSTQAYQSIVNEDRRVTKQRLNKDAKNAKSAVSAMAQATQELVDKTSTGRAPAPAAASDQPTKRKRAPESAAPAPAPELDSPVGWPLSKKKRILFGNIMAKMHENKTNEFAVAGSGDGKTEKIYRVKMEIDSVNLL